MKKRMAVLSLVLCLTISALPYARALEGEGERAVNTLAALHLVIGTPDGYAVNDAATQEQAATLIVRLLGEQEAAQASLRWCGWTGVPSWARMAINYCADHELILPSEYIPNGMLDANQWCTMLLRAVGFRDDLGAFTWQNAALTAQRIGLISQTLSGELTRGTMFETALEALRYTHRLENQSMLERLIAKGLCSRETAQSLGLFPQKLTARQIADSCTSAVFCIDLYHTEDDIKIGQPSSNASAFFIREDGLAVTNYHSIDGAIYGTATLVTGETFEIQKVLYYDPAIDIAVIKIATTSLDGILTPCFAALDMVGTDDIRTGDTIYAIGNPLGLGLAFSAGVISVTEREVDRYALPCIVNSADISQGSSGGALLNEYGHVIAVTSGAYTYGNNMYLAVPVNPVMSADLNVEGLSLQEVAALNVQTEQKTA